MRLAYLVVLLLGSAGCGPVTLPEPPAREQGEGPGRRAQPLALTPRQELALGRQAFAQILDEYGSRVEREGEAPEQVRAVTRRIVQAAAIEPLQREINLRVYGYAFEWQVVVIRSNQVNAFCLPGGKIGVFTGLLRVARSEDQLATVLAHEIAHALAHHSSERLARERQAGGGLLALSYGRFQELEADRIGLFLMTFAGYQPEEAVLFWQRMRNQAEGSGLPEILRTHPSDERRIAQLREMVPYVKGALRAYQEGRIAPAPRAAQAWPGGPAAPAPAARRERSVLFPSLAILEI